MVRRFITSPISPTTRAAARFVSSAVVIAVVIVTLSGCRPWRGFTTIELTREPATESTENSTVDQLPPLNLDTFQNVNWVRRAAVTGSTTAGSTNTTGSRWRNDSLDAVWSSSTVNRPALTRLLTNADPTIATNAALCLARLGETSSIDRLIATARDRSLPLKLRLPAIDALRDLDDPRIIAALREQLDAQEPAMPDLHAELLTTLAQHVSVTDDPRFVPEQDDLTPEVKLAVLDAWRQVGPTSVPQSLVDWRSDPDLRVRLVTLQMLVACESPAAFRAAQDCLNDRDLAVRLAAIHALGSFPTPEARKLITPLASHTGELVRAAAIDALERQGDQESVRQALEDKSWRVRATVATIIGRRPDTLHQAWAIQLLDDRSAEVQRQVVAAMTDWPLPLAGPVLLAALGKHNYALQKQAWQQLAPRWPTAREHSVELPKDQQGDSLANLQRRWSEQFDTLAATTSEQIAQPVPLANLSPADAGRAAAILSKSASLRVGERLAPSDREALVKLGPALLPWLERRLNDEQQPLAESVWFDVLPQLEPIFAVLVELASNDVATRRRAAERLATQAAKRAPNSLALDRLEQLMLREQDTLVWQTVMRLLQPIDDPAAIGIAYAGVSHRSADVRRVACAHLAEHPHRDHAQVLLPLLGDPQPGVVRTAVRALGQPDVLASLDPLRPLLAANDHRLRLDVAVLLSRVGDESGTAALDRLSFDADADIRRLTAQALGELGDPAFLGVLVRLLDQGQGVGQTALKSLEQLVGPEVTTQITADTVSSADRVATWRRWWDQQSAARAERRGGVIAP